MAAVEQRAGDDADGVREVDDPGVRRSDRAHALGDLEHDRHGAHRLRKAARTGRLLTDAPARERRRLVAESRVLAADPNLDQDEVGGLDGGVEVSGHVEPALESLSREHPSRHAADHVAPGGVDVLEHELVDVEAGQPGDELRRVGGSPADDGDLHSR